MVKRTSQWAEHQPTNILRRGQAPCFFPTKKAGRELFLGMFHVQSKASGFKSVVSIFFYSPSLNWI